VIEFTEDKTLWFNYNIFQNELDLINKDCTEERDLIKNWFESRFLNKPKVDETFDNAANMIHNIEDTIKNGVKHTRHWTRNHLDSLEDTIQNGVKNARPHYASHGSSIEDTIQNGVKETTPSGYLGSIEMKGKIVHQIESPKQNNEVEDTIQNGVKETQTRMWPPVGAVDETIENGVKECNWRRVDNFPDFENRVIENSVKETKENRLLRTINVISTIKNGVKEIQPLPAQDGNRDWGLYYNHMGRVEGVIRNTDKDGI
jgi:hypothetical protein